MMLNIDLKKVGDSWARSTENFQIWFADLSYNLLFRKEKKSYILLFKLRYFLIFLYRPPPPFFKKKNINKVETSQLPPEPSEEYMYIS